MVGPGMAALKKLIGEVRPNAGDGSGADPTALPHHNRRAVPADRPGTVEGNREPKVSGREAP